MSDKPLVNVERLCCTYETQRGLRAPTIVQAVHNVDLNIQTGEIMALVGESGSGKSTLGRTLVRLVRPTSGRVLFGGLDIARLRGRRLVAFHGDVQIVFQNPYQSLNPRMTIGAALNEVLAVWSKRREGVREQRVDELLAMVHLPAHFADKYPHQLSGGQRQRVAIARAMAVRPRLLVADEPVSALDVSAAARILNLLLELREKADLTCLFITHDIGLARVVADRIAVMHVGSVVELGEPEDIFTRPRDDYTKALIGAELHVNRVHDDPVPPPVDVDAAVVEPPQARGSVDETTGSTVGRPI